MEPTDDNLLLRQYVEDHSDEAFAALVTRHVNLVYSVALRHVGNPQWAEEIAQAVFIILAKKAAQLRHDKALSSWLFQTTRLTANNYVRSEARRQRREQEAYMQTALEETGEDIWRQIAPLLDTAVATLGEKNRRAIVLRFYEGRNLREVGVALGASEDTAKKRVTRALEKLRTFFIKRGVTLTTAILASAVSANSVHAAPMGLAATISATAAKGTAVATSTLTLVKGALNIMAWTKAKTAAVTVAAVILATGTTTIVVKEIATPKRAAAAIDDSFFAANPDRLMQAPAGLLVLRPSHFQKSSGPLMVSGYKGRTPHAPRACGQCISLRDLLAVAYNQFFSSRILLPESPNENVPDARYDLLLTVERNPIEQLQGEIKRQLGLVVRRETRETEVLLLKLKTSGAPGLKPGKGRASTSGYYMGGPNSGKYIATNSPISALAGYLEFAIKQVVIDETGLGGKYDIELDGRYLKSLDTIRDALLNQLGLELVPSRRPVEMLMVEKAN